MNWEKWPVTIVSAIVAGLPLSLFTYDIEEVRYTGGIALWIILAVGIFLFLNKLYSLTQSDNFLFGLFGAGFFASLITAVAFYAVRMSPLLAILTFAVIWMTAYMIINGLHEDWRKVKRVP